MEIPAEAYGAVRRRFTSLRYWELDADIEMVLKAAAPHIARQAQVKILLGMAAEDAAEIDKLTVREQNTVPGSQAAADVAARISAVHRSKARFERKLAALEKAGAR